MPVGAMRVWPGSAGGCCEQAASKVAVTVARRARPSRDIVMPRG
jgi:hypothetical protein